VSAEHSSGFRPRGILASLANRMGADRYHNTGIILLPAVSLQSRHTDVDASNDAASFQCFVERYRAHGSTDSTTQLTASCLAHASLPRTASAPTGRVILAKHLKSAATPSCLAQPVTNHLGWCTAPTGYLLLPGNVRLGAMVSGGSRSSHTKDRRARPGVAEFYQSW